MIDLKHEPKISILGCGWYGMALAKQFIADGYKVKGSTTTETKLTLLESLGIEPYLLDLESGNNQFDPAFFSCDLLIISIPPKRSTPSLGAYPEKIKAIASAARKANVQQIIFISSTGVYPDSNSVVNEQVLPVPESDSGKMILEAEQVLQQDQAFVTTIIRFAGLIGPGRNLAKHFAGKTNIANGLAPVNLIHLNDCLGLTKRIVVQQAYGQVYHGVAPHHPSRVDFYTKNCLLNGMAEPQFKNELTTWKQIEGINAPTILGYHYLISNWDDWLKSGSN